MLLNVQRSVDGLADLWLQNKRGFCFRKDSRVPTSSRIFLPKYGWTVAQNHHKSFGRFALRDLYFCMVPVVSGCGWLVLQGLARCCVGFFEVSCFFSEKNSLLGKRFHSVEVNVCFFPIMHILDLCWPSCAGEVEYPKDSGGSTRSTNGGYQRDPSSQYTERTRSGRIP